MPDSRSHSQGASRLGHPAQGEPRPRAKPFLRWAGSKRRQLPRLIQFWTDSHQRYIEPFAGSACLFFEIAPNQAILGDKNTSLIEVYRFVRDQPERLYNRLCRIKRDAETYYRWRSKLQADLDPETRALRFLYLNRNCFNGIYRTNTNGEFNVPMGSKLGKYFSKADLLLCSSLLKQAKLIPDDFERTLQLVRAGDFVYLDPPYAVRSRRVFREYGATLFDTADIERMAGSLTQIVQVGADFLVSYADCKESRNIARHWNAVRLPIRRHVAGFTGSRRHAYEWLISNMPISEGFHRGARRG
jgi:DNA adenine methylase